MEPLYQNKKVCEILKLRREQKRLSLHLIHQESKISVPYLEALESGQWDAFPAEVYLIGFLHKYSGYLGLDPEEMIQLYRKEIEVVKAKDEEKKKEEIELKRQLETRSLAKAAVLVGIVIFFGIWWSYTAIKSSYVRDEKKVESDQIKKISRSAFVQGDQLFLDIQAVKNVWVRIVADHELSFEGFLLAGTTRSWEAKDEFVISAGNSNFFKMSLNGYLIESKKGIKESLHELHLTHQTILDRSLSSLSEKSESVLSGGGKKASASDSQRTERQRLIETVPEMRRKGVNSLEGGGAVGDKKESAVPAVIGGGTVNESLNAAPSKKNPSKKPSEENIQ